jgi:hypothetical protein
MSESTGFEKPTAGMTCLLHNYRDQISTIGNLSIDLPPDQFSA